MGSRARIPLFLLGACLLVRPALALTDEEIFREFRFNPTNPGARSLAMGRAFISIADDSTAAQANPAGLTILLTPELFLEVRAVDNGTSTTRVRESLPGFDSNVVSGTRLDDSQSLSFLSGVYPFRKFTLAVSCQETLNSTSETLSRFDFASTDSPFQVSMQGTGAIDAQVAACNVSAGWKINDVFALGGSIGYSRLHLAAEVRNEIFDPGALVAPMPVFEPTLDLHTRIRHTDGDFGATVGLLVRRDRFGFGAVYRRAPKFSFVETIVPGRDRNGDGTFDSSIDVFGVRKRLGRRFSTPFNIPDTFGVGGNWKPDDRLTLALDIERTAWSQLLDSQVVGVNVLTSSKARFSVDDGVDLHAGAEYLLILKQRPLALRAGVSSLADSRIQAGSTGGSGLASEAAFPAGEREWRGAVGAGWVWRWLKMDLALDFGGNRTELLLSLIAQKQP